MNKNNAIFASKAISLSESEDKLYLELTNRLCYYDFPNYNSVVLPYEGVEESALQMAKSLINMPVQAKFKIINGNPDLGGHEMYQDEDGEYQFDTASIGVVTDVSIESEEVTTVDGETKVLPCLYAKERLWTRYTNVCSAVKRLYESGKLNSSWEIAINAYEFANNVKKLNDYSFMANTLLGSATTPAYGNTSTVLDMSERLMVAEALMSDIEALKDIEELNGDVTMDNKEEDIVVSSEEVVETPDVVEEVVVAEESIEETPQPEVSEEATEAPETTEEVSEATEEVTEVSEEVEASAVAYKETEIVEHITIIHDPVDFEEHERMMEECSRQLAEKDELILQSAQKISELEAQIAELNDYKAKWAEVEEARKADEIAECKKKIKKKCCASGLITEDEFDTNEELASLLDALDEKALSAIIGERLIAKLSAQTSTEVSEAKKSKSATPTRTVASVVDSDTTTEDKVNAFRKMFLK